MRFFLTAALPVVLAAAALSACGGSSAPDETPTPAGEPATDSEYMAMLCTGTTNYLVAVNSKPDAAAIGQTVVEWRDKIRATTPPADLQEWQKQFLSYLDGVVTDPLTGLTASAPLPPEAARKRLVSHVPEIAECKYRTFLETAAE